MRMRLHVRLDRLRKNYALVNALSGRARVAAVVKADGYGAGAGVCARALAREGCTFFYVYDIEEAAALRAWLPPSVRISFLSGITDTHDAQAAYTLKGIPVINHPSQYVLWHDICRKNNRIAPFSVQFDTGMTRSGCEAGAAPALAEMIAQDGMSRGLCYILSHLACADTPGHTMNTRQRRALTDIAASFPRARLSLANSSGVYLGKHFACAQVRSGAALYGIVPDGAPYPQRRPPHYPAPVLTLTSAVRELHRSDSPLYVGYGATQQVPAGTPLAMIDGGYADGIPYNAGQGHAGCIINGAYCPTVGKISMDSITVDVSACTRTPAPETPAQWFGHAQPAEAVARACGTIAYHLHTSVGARVIRRYHGT